MAHLEDDEYEIPFRDQRYFGAGIKRKRVRFVPSSTTESTIVPKEPSATGSAASRYLDIVLMGTTESSLDAAAPREQNTQLGEQAKTAVNVEDSADQLCEICSRPLDDTTTHNTSIAHQVCLVHSHPPSHIDRKRKGLQVLSSHGWDPDSRLGLGAAGEGRLYPVRATKNPEKAGLGLRPEDLVKQERVKPVRLDAGRVRKAEAEKKREGQKLRDAFYRSEDVERYLDAGEQNGEAAGEYEGLKQVRNTGLR